MGHYLDAEAGIPTGRCGIRGGVFFDASRDRSGVGHRTVQCIKPNLLVGREPGLDQHMTRELAKARQGEQRHEFGMQFDRRSGVRIRCGQAIGLLGHPEAL